MLISPCACEGGMKMVHSKCLMKWIQMRPEGTDRMTCEICKEVRGEGGGGGERSERGKAC